MPIHPRLAVTCAGILVALAAVLLAGCAGDAAGSASAPPPALDPPGERADPARPAGDVPVEGEAAPHELVLTSDLRSLAAGRDDADDAVVEQRLVVSGERRHLVTQVGGRTLDQHVMTPEEHWLWVPPELRDGLGVAEWVRFDVAGMVDAGVGLPDHVAAARGAMPAPEEVAVGDDLAGHEVLEVEPTGDDAVRVTVRGLPVPMELRRRPLPAGTTVDLPSGAVDVQDLPARLGW